MTDTELVRDALDEFMPCYGSEESAKRKREVLDAFGGIVARVSELELELLAYQGERALLKQEIESLRRNDPHLNL